jgi:diguanylate cyclase (GGDEF)-like protein/PAS domain S-box-containing protein
MKGNNVSDDPSITDPPPEPDGPGREAIEVLYRFVAAIELTPTIAVHSIDRAGIVRFWNRSCVALFGIPASDAVGKPLTSLARRLNGDEEFASVLESVWLNGSAAARDWHIARQDGQERWTYSTHFAVRRDGAPQQLFCMEVDITRRKVEELALAVAGANFHQLFTRSNDAIVLVQGKLIIDANPAALQLFHCTDKEQMIGRSLLDFSPITQPSGETSANGDATNASETYEAGNRRFEWRYQLHDGTSFWAEVLLTSVALNHEFLSFAVIRDISVRKEAENALQLAAQVFENARDAILVLDPHYHVISVNQAFGDITGFALDEVLGKDVPGLRAGVHEPTFYQQIWDYVSTQDHWEGELWSVRSNGEKFPAWAALTAIRDGQGQVTNYMAILADITGRKRIEERTRHLAEHDFLTDLPNRVLFLDRLQLALATARRQHTKLAIMFIDLDRFKQINDGHGHQVGDQVLKEVARRLTGCVRTVDTVSRLGGDEFVILLAGIGGVDQAAHIATNVMHSVAQPMTVGGQEMSLSVSIGIAMHPGDGDDIESLLKNADVAMYHAKQSGRDDFQFFNQAMNAHVIERVQMENKLREALERQEFVLEYQPEVAIDTGLTIGVEALLRWRHPERGLLPPDQFLAAAEECGLIVPIGEWVLGEACAQAQRWRAQGMPVVVSVNLSSVQFFHENLVACIDEALRVSGLPPQFLDLEITEGVIMNGDEDTVATVQALHQRGLRLTIDDFGTGYSSLSFLRRYPLSKLKIDRSFIQDISRDPNDAAMIPAIIAVARSLKLRVVAEGVETAEQLRFLQEHGCDEYQGYYASIASSDPDLTRRHS